MLHSGKLRRVELLLPLLKFIPEGLVRIVLSEVAKNGLRRESSMGDGFVACEKWTY